MMMMYSYSDMTPAVGRPMRAKQSKLCYMENLLELDSTDSNFICGVSGYAAQRVGFLYWKLNSFVASSIIFVVRIKFLKKNPITKRQCCGENSTRCAAYFGLNSLIKLDFFAND